MGRERGRTVLPWLVLRLTLGAIRVAGEIVGQSALVNAQLGIPQKDRATAMWNDPVRKRAQPTVAGAAFHCRCQKDPRKTDADGSWPPASVGTFPKRTY